MEPFTPILPGERFTVCHRCGSKELMDRETQPDEGGYGVHYGRRTCVDCGTFIKFLPDPVVTAHHERRKARAESLLKGDSLSEWERGFVRSIAKQRVLTERQKEKWEAILSKRQ